MTGSDVHWLDEIAARATRGGFLRAAVVAVGGLALPLARPSLGAAAAHDPTACRKGCFWASHKRALQADQTCFAKHGALSGQKAYTLFFVSPFLGAGLIYGTETLGRCRERVLLAEDAAQAACLAPDCPGFDPTQPGGPCEGCTAAGGHCCPDQKVVSGYSCCTGQGGCCDPSGDGCASGVTACGG